MNKGDIVICINDDSENEDFGMSGIVLYGRRDLAVGKEYEVENVDESQIPSQFRKYGSKYSTEKIWTDKEYESVKIAWTRIWLKGLSKPAWGCLFKLKK